MPEGKTIGQLMEEMRQKAGAQNYHGHDYMDLQRFAENTRHMIIFDVLTHDSPVGWKGERTRLFLSDKGYEKALDSQAKGQIKILSHAKVRNGDLLYTALYEKMAAEQDKFRDWLKRQPPEEILHHTYEYTVREDIVMAMEELELTDAQAQALLESPSPLADVYRYFEKLETGYMDVIRDSIESRADDVCRAKEELRTTPVYPHSAAYAREHGELEQYRASNNANLQCKESIEAAVREHFDGMYLSHDAAKGVIEIYGMERVAMVLANTVQLQDWDGRYSRRNKEWAKTIPNDNPETVRCGYALNSHPAVLDGFIDLVRVEQQRSRTQGEKLQPSRPSVRDKLKQELPAHKPAAPKKREPER